jgi:DNA-directed RNA polymerase sigma subunit (sigma70/sigma32)
VRALHQEEPAATWEEIAEAENITPGAARMCLTRALRKLRRQGLLLTCRELAEALDANRKGNH